MKCIRFSFPSETKCLGHYYNPSFVFIIFLSLSVGTMRPEENPLDLNNLPDDYSRDGKQLLQGTSSSGCKKKKSGIKDRKEECGKVYECRFCSLKFCKSQALGGHMNRHRQERETETLNHARQLVYRNDHNLTNEGAPHLGCYQPIASSGGSYHNMGDPTMRMRFPRYMSSSTSSSTYMSPPSPSPQQPFLYPSPSRPFSSFPSHTHYNSHQNPVSDYYVGHVLNGHNLNYVAGRESNYTCIGAPVGQVLGKDRTLQNQEEGMNWGRSYSVTHQLLDPSSSINRFQDGF